MSYNEKKKIPYKVIISVLIAMLILGTLIAFNFTRIRLMTKGYGWSEQSIILQLMIMRLSVIWMRKRSVI